MPRLNVVLFTGGRGSRVLSKELVAHRDVALTLAINGYDDGKSTGEVRRYLGRTLGPSDFRKNASWLARQLESAPAALIDLLEFRFSLECTSAQAVSALDTLADPEQPRASLPWKELAAAGDLESPWRQDLARPLASFLRELRSSERTFSFADCSLGNIVFAGLFLLTDRDFNRCVSEYCRLLRLPEDSILNVTNGENAHLAAITKDHRLLATEAEIVDGNHSSEIEEIFLLENELTPSERRSIGHGDPRDMAELLSKREVNPTANPVLLERLRSADLIIYAPGTQYSSLYPSYLTPGVGAAISSNLRAIKLLITNIKPDAETAASNAVDIVEGAVFYLREKGRKRIPVPCLITHYLINDPTMPDGPAPYIPPGPWESLEDPRLVRIASYEDRVSGRHDAERVLTPYVRSLLSQPAPLRVGILLLETSSINKITQTVLEMLRGGILDLRSLPQVAYQSPEPLDASFTEQSPIPLHNIFVEGESAAASFGRFCRENDFDYLVLFESSGMYRGEDIINVMSHLAWGEMDAIWGSRRLSVKEIHSSYRFRYRDSPLLAAISYIGSHLLSLIYLVLYGRFPTDTLSGIRAVRANLIREYDISLDDRSLNHFLLSVIFRASGEVLETPVRFVPLSSSKVRRTTVGEGLQAIVKVLWWRLRAPRSASPSA